MARASKKCWLNTPTTNNNRINDIFIYILQFFILTRYPEGNPWIKLVSLLSSSSIILSLLLLLSAWKEFSEVYCFELRLWFCFFFLSARKKISGEYCFELRLWFCFIIHTERIFRRILFWATSDFYFFFIFYFSFFLCYYDASWKPQPIRTKFSHMTFY